MTIDWTGQLVDQLDWHWQQHLRPRLAGLSDEEWGWEPVAGCWSVRPGATAGEFTFESKWPEPVPPPVTTIAWRLAHLVAGVFGTRVAAHFGGPPCNYRTFPYAGAAAGALRQLDEAYAGWVKGVRELDSDALARPCGPAEGPFGELPMAALVLHINRETIHHGAEICLLRDLYRNQR